MSYRLKAEKMWPEAMWIVGDARFATVAKCRDVTVTLWGSPEAAEASLRTINQTGCGSACGFDRHGVHEVVDLETAVVPDTNPAGVVELDPFEELFADMSSVFKSIDETGKCMPEALDPNKAARHAFKAAADEIQQVLVRNRKKADGRRRMVRVDGQGSSSKEIDEASRRLRAAETAFFEEAFEGLDVPKDIRAAAEHIVRAYGIRGICDPAYIANVIALHTGRGDGKSSFNQPRPEGP